MILQYDECVFPESGDQDDGQVVTRLNRTGAHTDFCRRDTQWEKRSNQHAIIACVSMTQPKTTYVTENMTVVAHD
jgi:hypothetical protein